MARATALTNTLVMGPAVVEKATANAVTGGTAFYVDSDQMDERTIFVFTPSAGSGQITVHKGDGYGGAADLVLAAATSGGIYCFTIDSVRHTICNGENKGLIKMTPSVSGTFQIIQARV